MPKIVKGDEAKMLMTSIRISRVIKRQIEAYAKLKRISEAEVYRRAIDKLISSEESNLKEFLNITEK
jgi:ribosomal protein L30E